MPSLDALVRRPWDRPTERDWAELLSALPLFSHVGKRRLRGIAKLARVADYPPGETIVRAGDKGESFYVVLEGRASVAGRSRTLGPGAYFGEIALIDGGPRSATVTAKTRTRVMELPRRAFMKALEQDARIALEIMEALAERVRRLERAPSA